ncbi:MAG: nickel-dependent hydrogenase large subunit [Desulfovibrionaceae bacterium]|nr:nickel-dependent hydrogenase large subunit [Desulfovibrionaceae bacterium]
MSNKLADKDIVCAGNTFVLCVRLCNGRVDEVWSTGKMVRNPDLLLEGGLDEGGAPRFVQRAHCLCNDAHALAAVRAIEDLAGVVPPRNARLVRSLVQAVRCIQDHLVHVYQFYLSDWLGVDRALRADPAKAARLAGPSGNRAGFFQNAQARLRALAQGGADVFSAASPDHPARQAPDELHLLVHGHGQASLEARAKLAKILDSLGCSDSRHPAYQVGGLSEDMDLGPLVRDRLRVLMQDCRDFVCRTFAPDLARIASAYPEWAGIGRTGTFLAWGDFSQPSGDGRLFPGGVFTMAETAGGETTLQVHPAHPDQVTELCDQSWTPEHADRYQLRFGANGPSCRWPEGAFEWLAAPRHGEQACEVGPLARVLGACAQGRVAVREMLDKTLGPANLGLGAMNSTLGRLLARGIESAVLAQAAMGWLDSLDASLAHGDRTMSRPWTLPCSGLGTGRVEVARGALTHTISVRKNRIARHDYLIPSLWNFSPRSADGVRGPLEQALMDTPVADALRPREILRTVHAFDPCNACVLLVQDADSGQMITVNAR